MMRIRFNVQGSFDQELKLIAPGWKPEKVLSGLQLGTLATTMCVGSGGHVEEIATGKVIARIVDTDVYNAEPYEDFELIDD